MFLRVCKGWYIYFFHRFSYKKYKKKKIAILNKIELSDEELDKVTVGSSNEDEIPPCERDR